MTAIVKTKTDCWDLIKWLFAFQNALKKSCQTVSYQWIENVKFLYLALLQLNRCVTNRLALVRVTLSSWRHCYWVDKMFPWQIGKLIFYSLPHSGCLKTTSLFYMFYGSHPPSNLAGIITETGLVFMYFWKVKQRFFSDLFPVPLPCFRSSPAVTTPLWPMTQCTFKNCWLYPH